MDMITLIGIVGAACVLIAYVGGQLRMLTTTSIWYDGLNVLGSALLIWYAVLLGSIPFIVLNAVWIIFSLKDMIRRII